MNNAAFSGGERVDKKQISGIWFICGVISCDFLFNTFITGKGYQFSPIIDLVVPLAVSVTVGCILFLRKKK